jgi:hypothetical protein
METNKSKNMTIFKLRAECRFDLDLFIKIANLSEIKITKIENYPDCELEFLSDKSIEELRDLMLGIPDSHVMKETLSEFKNYTGLRFNQA